jgi:NAD(P)H-hydrate epimerase
MNGNKYINLFLLTAEEFIFVLSILLIMKIFQTDQIRTLDKFTIRYEPVSSVDLMERAAGKIFEWYISRFDSSVPLMIFTGPGNNGGDGLVLARMFYKNNYRPEVYFVQITENTSTDWKINKDRLLKETDVPFKTIKNVDQFPAPCPGSVIIDAIFGSGLTRRVQGLARDVISRINNSGSKVISVDIPSGLFGEDNSDNDPDSIIKADHTLSFQFPKLSFMFPENEKYTGDWTILPIGLHNEAIENTVTPYIFLEKCSVKLILKARKKFDHKGNFGHGLLIGGSYGKMGAVVLGGKAALRSGIGLITCHIPSRGDLILQSSVPEAMVMHDVSEHIITGIGNTENFSAIGVGPGMGTDPLSQKALEKLLTNCEKPMVIDADALNILSQNKKWLSKIRSGTILTPHPKEFERLVGKSESGFDRLNKQISFSAEHNCIVVLKGANTSITSPDGNVWFNSTGNPGMATAGSGDVLTGMILSLLAQSYTPLNAAITAVFLHGLAGDIATERMPQESMIATDIINGISDAILRIKESK